MGMQFYADAYDELKYRRQSAVDEYNTLMRNPRTWEMFHSGTLSQAKQEIRTFWEVCDRSDAFYVDPDIAEAIGRASEALPLDYKLSIKDLPQDFGFIWSNKRLPVDPDDYSLEYGPEALYHLHGMAWGVITRDDNVKQLWLYNLPARNAVIGVFIEGKLNKVQGISQFSTLTTWTEGVSIQQLLDSITISEKTISGREVRVMTPPPASQVRWFMAFCLWLQGEILTTSSQRLPRHTLRRHKIHDGSVRLVMLRRRNYINKKEGDGEPVEWSCRWLVRGHWRRLVDKKTGQERTVWVSPYIKGPEDKPFRKPKQNLFAVTR